MATDSNLEDLEERLTASRNLRRVQEGGWLVNMAMYLNHQWVKVDPSGRLYTVETGDEMPTLTQNIFMPAVRSDIAKMTKEQLQWVGVPKNRSDEEIQAARLRENIFDDYWQRLQMRRKLRNGLHYQRLCGAGFFKTTWDFYTGKSARAVYRQGEKSPLTDSRGVPYRSMADIPEGLQNGLEERDKRFGDVCVEFKSPFEILPDALATEDGLSTCEYIGEECIYSPAYLRERFNKDFEADAKATGGTLESRYPGFSGVLQQGRGAAGRMGVKVREYWSLPGVDDPQGRHVVWTVNGELLIEEALPYPWLPYTMIGGLPAGRFWPMSPMDAAVSPQVELNKTISQIAANAERIGNPITAIPAGALQEGETFHGLPGEQIIWEDMGSGLGQVFVQPPEVPAYVQDRIGQITEAVQRITAQMEVSQGGVPPGVTAASAINLLIEENDTSLGPDIAEMEDAMTDIGRKLLWLLAKNATDERVLRISGENGAWDIKVWRGLQLRDGGADEVQAGSGIPQSKAAKQAAIRDYVNLFIQNGISLPPQTLRRVMADMQVGGLDHFFSDTGKTEAQIEDEHRRMLEGEGVQGAQPVLEPIPGVIDPRTGQPAMQQATTSEGVPLFYGIPINDFDEDDLHLDGHYAFFRSPRFLEVGKTIEGKQLQNLMLGHAKLHEIKLQQSANNQAAAQMTMDNANAQNGPPLDPNSLNGAQNPVPSGPTQPGG